MANVLALPVLVVILPQSSAVSLTFPVVPLPPRNDLSSTYPERRHPNDEQEEVGLSSPPKNGVILSAVVHGALEQRSRRTCICPLLYCCHCCYARDPVRERLSSCSCTYPIQASIPENPVKPQRCKSPRQTRANAWRISFAPSAILEAELKEDAFGRQSEGIVV
jgi:hypothetical protein